MQGKIVTGINLIAGHWTGRIVTRVRSDGERAACIGNGSAGVGDSAVRWRRRKTDDRNEEADRAEGKCDENTRIKRAAFGWLRFFHNRVIFSDLTMIRA